MKEKETRQKSEGPKRLLWVLFLLWAIILLILLLKSCEEDYPGPPVVRQKDTSLARPYEREVSVDTASDSLPDSTVLIQDSTTTVTEEKRLEEPIDPNEGKYKLLLSDSAKKEVEPIDSLYVFADPWGGRHFDSVRVSLFCRESCIILYAFDDSLNLKSYDQAFTIKRNRELWIAGVNEKGEQSLPVKITYTIEKKSGDCPENMLPVSQGTISICMDVYEWPNQRGAFPSAYVSHKEAADSCAGEDKRLCTVEEWQTACRGIDQARYPYGSGYNENYCPSKEASSKRSGRYPACRSYYGIYDLTGNIWEWTGTPAPQREGFFMVAGGNWDAGNQATCNETKYSFYPQNKYLFVGFRCCQDLIEK